MRSCEKNTQKKHPRTVDKNMIGENYSNKIAEATCNLSYRNKNDFFDLSTPQHMNQANYLQNDNHSETASNDPPIKLRLFFKEIIDLVNKISHIKYCKLII